MANPQDGADVIAPQQTSSNGAGRGGIPSQQDLLIERQHQANLAREMLTFSDTPSEMLARTDLNEHIIARDMRILAKFNVLHVGKADVEYLLWWNLGARCSLARQGRKEAVEMITAERKHMMNFRNRFRQQGQDQGPQG